jgi:hypothetical protein
MWDVMHPALPSSLLPRSGIRRRRGNPDNLRAGGQVYYKTRPIPLDFPARFFSLPFFFSLFPPRPSRFSLPVMRILSFIPALAVLVTAVAGVATPPSCGDSEIACGPDPTTIKRDFLEHPARDGHALTNAELVRRGLPLNAPVLRRGTFLPLFHITLPLLRHCRLLQVLPSVAPTLRLCPHRRSRSLAPESSRSSTLTTTTFSVTSPRTW